ncbi:MAG: type II toxin-antitoxin system mRNA interferase toxin, RelE/StbE family [Patescibacteria group bacterium]
MIIKRVYYSSSFHKSLKKYTKDKNLIIKKLDRFLLNPFDPSLKTHKLSGKLLSYWSFSINYHLRVLFEFIDEEAVGLIDVGTHEVYK